MVEGWTKLLLLADKVNVYVPAGGSVLVPAGALPLWPPLEQPPITTSEINVAVASGTQAATRRNLLGNSNARPPDNTARPACSPNEDCGRDGWLYARVDATAIDTLTLLGEEPTVALEGRLQAMKL